MKAERIFVNECVNTMEAMEERLKQTSLREGSCVYAGFQQGGVGQDGNVWESEADLNLLSTFVLYPTFLPPAQQFLLSKVISLAVYDTILSESPRSEVWIKWPNDIYVGHAKAAGILLRTRISGDRINRALAGIGINVNQTVFSDKLSNPVSLKMVDGVDRDIPSFLGILAANLMAFYDLLILGEFEWIDHLYYRRLYRLEQRGKYTINGVEMTARITGVDGYGRLVLKDGKKEFVCDLKEVVYL